MDAQHLAFPSESFDSVAFNLVLCTIPDQRLALDEAIRVARPGATITFLEHVRSNRAWVATPQDVMNRVIGRAIHDRINSETEAIVRDAGIEVLSVDRWMLGAMTLIVARAPDR